MDRVADIALPAASLLTALLAVSLWRRPRPDVDADAAPEAPEVTDLRSAPSGLTVEWGVLQLSGSQLVGVWLEAGDLVVDLFGGSGLWRGYAGEACVDEGEVTGTAMLTLRASFSSHIDLAALERLEAWCEDGGVVNLEMEIDGATPVGPPRRIVLGNGRQTVALLSRGAPAT
jgi:hypothetical protein